jgi:hypothetical protein
MVFLGDSRAFVEFLSGRKCWRERTRVDFWEILVDFWSV